MLIDTERFQKFVTDVRTLKGKESIFGMLFNNSSFQSLDLWISDDHSDDVNTIRSIMSYLEINTCVTELLVYLRGVYVNRIDATVRVIKYNTTLKHFKIMTIPFPEKIDDVRQIANALQNNTTLSDVELGIEGYFEGLGIHHNNLYSYMATNYPDLTRDTRLSYKHYF